MGGPLLFVVGTRPEAIKLAPVVMEARLRGSHTLLCATAQHRDLLDQALGLFGLKPDIDLDLMRPGQALASLTARILEGLSDTFSRLEPSWVIVQGDTTTAFAAALAAYYVGAPVAHVEAGLRTGHPREPFPEEINRRLVADLANVHFAPTPLARDNLISEGILAESIFVTGNTVVDALQSVLERIDSVPPGEVVETQRWAASAIHDAPMVLVTAHRRESFGSGMESICAAVTDLSRRFPGTHFVFPVHPNPAVAGHVRARLGDISNIHMLPAQPYASFVWLLRRSSCILSDSGGVQEEAPSLGRRVLVMRNVTERPEALAAGHLVLVGTDREAIVSRCAEILDGVSPNPAGPNPYGDGHASPRIVDVLLTSTHSARSTTVAKRPKG